MPKTSTTTAKKSTTRATKNDQRTSGNVARTGGNSSRTGGNSSRTGSNSSRTGGNSSRTGSNTSRTGRAASRAAASSSKAPSGRASSARANTSVKGTPSDDSKLREFFLDELKDIYWAENKLVKTLPKLMKAATSDELRTAFEDHLEETKTHVQRLEQAFKLLGEKAVAKKCDAMQGITEEGASVIEDTEKGTSTRDVALIMAGQKAEHYEIATYGGLVQIARTLGHDDVAELLQQTLQEEKQADEKLTQIAENNINEEASGEEED